MHANIAILVTKLDDLYKFVTHFLKQIKVWINKQPKTQITKLDLDMKIHYNYML